MPLQVSSAASAATDRPDTIQAASSAAPTAKGEWVHETLATADDQDWFRYDVTSAGRYRITLGDLPANYSLELYRSDGTRIARSDHVRRGFEELYRRLDAGTYYLRVDSTKGFDAEQAYVVRFRHLPAPVPVLSRRFPCTQGCGFLLQFEFLNNTDHWRFAPYVRATFRDRDGRVLGHHDGYVDISAMPPGVPVSGLLAEGPAAQGHRLLLAPRGQRAHRYQDHAGAPVVAGVRSALRRALLLLPRHGLEPEVAPRRGQRLRRTVRRPRSHARRQPGLRRGSAGRVRSVEREVLRAVAQPDARELLRELTSSDSCKDRRP